MIGMAEQWLTYAEFGDRIGITRDAARFRASRLKLRRQIGNDGKVRVAVDLDEIVLNPPKPPARSSGDGPVMITLADHPAGERWSDLKEQLAKAEAMAERERVERFQERERADRLTGEVADLARQLAKVAEEAGARERDLQVQLAEHMAEAERARAEAEKQAAVTREKADTLAAQLDLERHRAGELCQERDQVLERLDRAVERLNQVQAEHHAEVMAVREQMARAEHDHHRAAAELAAHLALPWWRRLFA